MDTTIAPGFLVAVPQLGDPNFQRSVVLMLEHGENGAMGIVINRPGSVKLGDVARSHGVDPNDSLESKVAYVGGPVEPERGFVLHSCHEVSEAVPLFEGLYVSGSVESLKELFLQPVDRFRLCLGYAGWAPGQLEKELQEGSWITATAQMKHVLTTPPESAWEAILREMGIDPVMLMQGGGLN